MIGAARDALDKIGQSLGELGFERVNKLGRAVWQGEKDGRRCTVTVARQSRTRYFGEIRVRLPLGYRLRVEAPTSVKARLFFVRERYTRMAWIRFVYRLRKQLVLDHVPGELDGFRVVARDAGWAEALLGQREAVRAVGAMLNENATDALAGSVHFYAGTVHYASPILQPEHLAAKNVVAALDRVLTLAHAAERIPAPTVHYEPGWFELLGQRYPLLVGFFLTVLILAGLACSVVAIVVLAVYLGR